MYGQMPYQATNLNQMYSNNQLNNPYYNQAQSALERLEKLQNQQQNIPTQSQQVPITNVNWVQVEDIEAAKKRFVPQNNTMWMMDSYLPRVYVKAVSSIGEVQFKPYELLPLDENGNRINDLKNPEQNINNTQYVPIEDFNNLSNMVMKLNDKMTTYESLIASKPEKEKGATKRGGTNNE